MARRKERGQDKETQREHREDKCPVTWVHVGNRRVLVDGATWPEGSSDICREEGTL